MRLCPNCSIRPRQKHFNSKWCLPCADGFRAKPKHTLTPTQIKEVRKRLHKMPKAQICSELGISWSSLGRWASSQGIRVAYFNRYAVNPKLVETVCEYYARHGRQKTQERFPDIRVRSIVERYEVTPRQIRWTGEQMRELAQMAGLVSFVSQAKYFNRPRANAGSIKSVHMKRFGQGGGMLNGLSWHKARHLVRPRCRPIKTAFWSTRHPLKRTPMSRKIVLWVDLERNLKPGIPPEIRRAIGSAAKVQQWIHGVEHVRPRVLRLIKEREVHAK